MRHLARLIFIWVTVFRFGLDEIALSSFRQRWVRTLARVLMLGRRFAAPRGERLRLGLETLGPIFVKFGQVMSTRRDLIPADIARLTADGTISGGMIPKLETCVHAVEAGCEAAVVLDGRVGHAMLLEFFTSRGAGTLVRAG